MLFGLFEDIEGTVIGVLLVFLVFLMVLVILRS